MRKADSTEPAASSPAGVTTSRSPAPPARVEFDAKGDRKDAEGTIFSMKAKEVVPVAIVKNGVSTPFKTTAPAAPTREPAPAAPAKEEAKKGDAQPAKPKK